MATTSNRARGKPARGNVRQVIGSNGEETGTVPDGLSDTELKKMMELMLLGRRLDQQAIALQRRGKLGTYAPLAGQEASSVGSSFALDPAVDYLVPQYREQLAMLHWGLSLGVYLLQRYGHPSGATLPESGKLFPQQVALAAHLPHAVGLAWGANLNGENAVVVCHFGDGASSEGDAHESMNLAGILKAPVIFVLQNNGWAISTPVEKQTAGDLAARSLGYGIAGEKVDGNDVLAMYGATREAKTRALDGDGATLIEAVTFRLGAHTTADDPSKYLDASVVEQAKKHDPILRFARWLSNQGLWNEETEAEANARIDTVFEEAIAEFDAAGPLRPEAMFDHVFAEEPPRLIRQRAEYLEFYAGGGNK